MLYFFYFIWPNNLFFFFQTLSFSNISKCLCLLHCCTQGELQHIYINAYTSVYIYGKLHLLLVLLLFYVIAIFLLSKTNQEDMTYFITYVFYITQCVINENIYLVAHVPISIFLPNLKLFMYFFLIFEISVHIGRVDEERIPMIQPSPRISNLHPNVAKVWKKISYDFQ